MESAHSMGKERSWLRLTLVRASSHPVLLCSGSCIFCMGTDLGACMHSTLCFHDIHCQLGVRLAAR